MFMVLNRTCRSVVGPIKCIFFYNLSYHKVTSILDYTCLHVLHAHLLNNPESGIATEADKSALGTINRPLRAVGAKVTYMLLAPIVAQERPNRPGDDGESESGSTVPDVGRVSVAERSARGQEPSGVSVLPRGLGRWAAPSTTRSRPHNDHSAASRHSSFCVH